MELRALIVLFISITGFAVTMVPQKSGSNVNIKFEEIDFPTDFSKTLKSGFSNIFVMQMHVWKNGKVQNSKQVSTKIVFDLWDEVFYVKRSGDSESNEKVSDKVDILNRIKTYTFNAALPLSAFNSNDVFEVSIRVVVDPISKEKQQKIKTWLAENRVSVPAGPTEKNNIQAIAKNSVSGTAIETVKRSVFNQVLDAEMSDDVVNGEWIFESEKMKITEKEIKNAK